MSENEKEMEQEEEKIEESTVATENEPVEVEASVEPTIVEPTIEERKKPEITEDGSLSVTAENIFPIIKQWLYTEKEIFIRELVSNATDAISKLKKLTSMGELELTEEEDFRIAIRIDKVAKKIIIEDNGVGLDAGEIKSFINEVAFSGATDFVDKFKDKMDKEQLIGHFGLGFYSSFMVADQVEIQSLSWKKEAKPAYWSCDGSTKFEIGEGDRTKRGTEIILSLSEDSQELLDEATLKKLVVKYSRFLPYPVTLNGVDIGMKEPLWKKSPSKLEDKDYLDFYKILYPYEPDPLFWIHLNVDYPFNLTGVLYFPKLKNEFDTSKSQIQLYCNNVFVSDNCKDIIPEFLNVLRGCLDSPDIPLNVSRSQLQSDPQVRKITTHIIKKIADRLKYLNKNERETYEKYWEDIHPFVKYGAMTDNKFWERVEDHVLFRSSSDDHKYTNCKEYLERNEKKSPKKIFYAADLEAEKSSYLQLYKEQGFEVLYMSHPMIDPHFVQFLESKMDKVSFTRIDSEVIDDLVEDKKEVVDGSTNKTPSQVLEDLFKKELGREKLQVKVQYLKSDKISGLVVLPEMQRRMKEMMQSMNRGGDQMGFGDDHTLVVNASHSLVQNLKTLQGKEDDTSKKKLNLLCEQVYDLALLNQKRFTPEETEKFVQRSNEIMELLAETK